MTITHAEMVRKLAKSGEAILATMTPQKLHVWHMASCLMGEAGEVIGNLDEENLLEELGDLEFYMSGLRDGLNIRLEEIPACVIQQEQILYPQDGLMIACCDIFDACKKWIIYEKFHVDRNPLLIALSRYELYTNLIREENNFTREQVLQANMDKLAKRYGPDYTYTNASAQNRADKT